MRFLNRFIQDKDNGSGFGFLYDNQNKAIQITFFDQIENTRKVVANIISITIIKMAEIKVDSSASDIPFTNYPLILYRDTLR